MSDFYFASTAVGKYKVKVAPVVLLTIMDHFTRRDENQKRVIGTLLGVLSESGEVEVKNCFPVPHTEENDQVSVDTLFHDTMLKMYQEVNSKEIIVGWYATGDSVNQLSVLIHQYFGKEIQKQGKDITQPVHLLVDTSLNGGKLAIKAFCSSAIGTGEDSVGTVFVEAPCEVSQTTAEKIAMRVIANSETKTQSKVGLVSDLENLESAIQKLIEMLTRVTNYVDRVLGDKSLADPAIGRLLMDIVTSVPKIDKAQFEQSFNNNVQDLLMVVYLANMTRAQLGIAEKLQTIA